MEEWIQNVLEYHNKIRAEKGIGPLQMDETLNEQAYNSSLYLSQEDDLFHYDVPLQGLQNVAQGYLVWTKNYHKVVDLWLQDPLHSAPILDINKSKLGIAYNKHPDSNRIYIVANYI